MMLRWIYILFICSGFLGLIYEGLWARYLKLFLGHSSYGQILTLIIYMGGIGIGSFLGSRLLKKFKNPFLLYSMVELLIGISALGYHYGYLVSTEFIYSIIQNNTITPFTAHTLKIISSMILTTPLAVLLGMTFPALASGVMMLTGDYGKKTLSILYFTNSIGAAIGILAGSYIFLPLLGTSQLLIFAGIGNILIAVGFYFISERTEAKILEQKVHLEKKEVRYKLTTFWLMISALTGFSSFVYEIGWIRLLSLILGSSTHSFDLMVSAFIFGLAWGGLYAKKIMEKTDNLPILLGKVQIAMGIGALCSIYLYEPFFHLINGWHGTFQLNDTTYWVWTLFKYFISLLLMGPASFCAGMTLPMITYLLTQKNSDSSFTGYVYGWNTLGSICGAAAGGLLILPLLQLKNTIAAGAFLDMITGVIIFALYQKRKHLVSPVFISVMAALPLLFISFDSSITTAGAYRKKMDYGFEGKQKITVRHGVTATISFHEHDAVRTLRTNGKPAASYTLNRYYARITDDYTQAALAFFPMSIMDKKYNAAIIGMGSGFTAHYLLTDPLLEKLDIIEIEEEVYNLSKGFLPYNRLAYTDKRASRIVNDAKTYFLLNKQKYDLILSEPSNPWVSGVANLFTKEFFKKMSEQIHEDGYLVQWTNLYEFNNDLLLSIVKAMEIYFPHIKIYQVPNSSDIILIGSRKDFYFSGYNRIANSPNIHKVFPLMKRDPGLFSGRNYLISNIGLQGVLRGYEPNSDFNPIVDNGAEKAYYLKEKVDLFIPYSEVYNPYTRVLEPEHFKNSKVREPYNEWIYFVNEQNVEVLENQLIVANRASDWELIEKRFYSAVPFTRDSTIWDSLPVVKLLKKHIAEKIVPQKTELRFMLINSVIHNQKSEIIDYSKKALSEFEKDDLMPLIIRTMLICALEEQEDILYDRLKKVFVINNNKFDFYELKLLKSLEQKYLN